MAITETYKTIKIRGQSKIGPPNSRKPIILTIAGSDPSGGAGIETDLKTITSLGCYGITCIDGLTIQNTLGVKGKVITPFYLIDSILNDNFNDYEIIDAVKIGMITDEVVKWFNEKYDSYKDRIRFIVVDPIINSSSGFTLAKLNLVQKCIKSVYPRASLLTPNYDEGLKIIEVMGCDVNELFPEKSSLEKFKQICKFLAINLNCKAVLLKGGHLPEEHESNQQKQSSNPNDLIYEILYNSTIDKFTIFKHNKLVNLKNTHGTGCTLSSAISSYLGLGYDLEDSVKHAIVYVHEALVNGDTSIGEGCGPLNHLWNL